MHVTHPRPTVPQAAIFTFGSLAASTPYLGLILTAVILNWIRRWGAQGAYILETDTAVGLHVGLHVSPALATTAGVLRGVALVPTRTL